MGAEAVDVDGQTAAVGQRSAHGLLEHLRQMENHEQRVVVVVCDYVRAGVGAA